MENAHRGFLNIKWCWMRPFWLKIMNWLIVGNRFSMWSLINKCVIYIPCCLQATTTSVTQMLDQRRTSDSCVCVRILHTGVLLMLHWQKKTLIDRRPTGHRSCQTSDNEDYDGWFPARQPALWAVKLHFSSGVPTNVASLHLQNNATQN